MSDPAARFHLVSGNRLDVLAAHLAARLAHPADPDSLVPETILIPQPTLRHWLERALAERLGVIANLDLCTPSEFVWRLLRASQPRLPDVSPWDRPRLRWRLYDLLATTPAQDLPEPVRAHLARAGAGTGARDRDALARDALADAVAGAFDKYQAYRRDWLTLWERGGDGDDWQAALWRALRARAPDRPHRAALIGDWLARHDRRRDAATPPPGLPPRLAAFGTIHVSPDVLHLLAVVGQWSALDFYLPTPSAEYWGDVETLRARLRRDGPDALPTALAEAQADNPLLQAWGSGGREIVAQLFAYDVVEPERETECFVPAGRDTLLHRLQQDVLERAAPTRASDATALAGDVSLQLHACHSKLREIEVLHDQLRALLDDTRFDPPLAPHEIAVLAPDIADYLPLARAVFGGVPADDPRHIPFSLADRPQAQAHPLVRVFLELLALGERPLTASRFRDVLAASAFARTLDGARRARIDDWIDAVGIRWGEDADAREREGVGRWREYSFAFGMERLLGGYALADARPFDAGVVGSGDDALLAPYPELEGADAELLDGTLSLLARLRALGAWMRGAHTADVWRTGLVEAFDALFAPLEDTSSSAPASQAARRCIVETLDTFAQDAVDGGALPVALVRRVLDEALSQPSAHQPWLSGGVTFAGMVPLRTVPFRVICLLGLDAEAYPRRETGDDINRLVDAVQGRAPRRLGDRSVRDDDRFLFLQLLCAADDVFYLSYGGRDARDGSVREPSPVIAELLDAVEAMHGEAVRDALCVTHPLQPFSPRAFGAGDGPDAHARDGHADEGHAHEEHGDDASTSGTATREPRRFSYRREWRMPGVDAAALRTAPAFVPSMAQRPEALSDALSDEDADPDEMPDRDALQRFFANPAKAWLRDRRGLRLPETDERTPDREPLGVDGLLRYGALDALLKVDDAALDDAARQLRARGLLPPGRDGERLAESVRASALRLREARATRLAGRTAAVVRDDAGRGVDFRFDDVHDGQRVLVSAGRLDGKRRLRAGIEHLLLATALGDAADTRLLGLDKGKGKEKDTEIVVEAVWTGIDRVEAGERLDALLALWREGRHSPLPFAPKSAYAYVEALRGKRDPDAAWRAALSAYAPYRMSGEQDDAWLRLAFRPHGLLDAIDSPTGRRFREIALQVFDATGTGA